ncbi:MAG: tRNA (guanine(10)-N(2))-dimethyltransferase [Candidatus Bathyarchaeota archaeon]|nr:tRNA (guanine(10)-N(2))-dimethyltransferase [Candidatus Bathyarchaeota archaeon]
MTSKEPLLDFPLEVVSEGEVEVYVPRLEFFKKQPQDYAPCMAPVFYNPAMELNRDIAVIALQAYQRMVNRELAVCEPLAGCGIRGIRFGREVEGVKTVVIGDISLKAYRLMRYNIAVNRLEGRVIAKRADATSLLACHSGPRRRFDVIDVDPFGSPAPFLDSSIKALRNGGLIALTATDTAPLCGVHVKACIRKYGGRPLRTEYCHELAVRLLMGLLSVTAARHEMGIKPLFSHSTDHYVRVYAVLKHGAEMADKTLSQMGYVLHCFNCFHRETVCESTLLQHGISCPECGSKMDYAGPLWLGCLWDREFHALMMEETGRKKLGCMKRVMQILKLIREEINAPPTYFVLDKICDNLGLSIPSKTKIIEMLKSWGFVATSTHFHPRGIRTNASAAQVKQALLKVSSSK